VQRNILRLVLLAALAALSPVRAAAPLRIVVVGDVHGGAAAFASILQRAGLIDAQKQWIGGTTVFVQTGDVMDRGTDVRQALDLLMALEPQAAKAGGRVHALLGNHEVMNILGETRDATPLIFQTFADIDSDLRLTRAFSAAQRINKGAMLNKTAWLNAHPPGLIEYRDAFKPGGKYGKWLRSKPIAVEINGTIFMHGGLAPDWKADSLDDVNRRVRQEIAAWDDGVRWLEQKKLVMPFATINEVVAAADEELRPIAPQLKQGQASPEELQTAQVLVPILQIDTSSLVTPNGPLWFRGYATWSDNEGAPLMAAVLKKYKATRFVTAHTPLAPAYRIVQRFGGALFLIDTGMLDGKYFPGGRASALEIIDDAVTAIYEDSRVTFGPSATGSPDR
jgi:hypothetical protein